MKLYIFRAIPLSIIRSLFTVHLAMAYVIQVCVTYAIAECTVNEVLMMDRGIARNM